MSIKNKHKEKNNTKVFDDMEVGHLMEEAETWWDKRGRHMLKKRQFSNENKSQQVALDATNPVHPNYIGGVSNILLGNQWSELRPEEHYQILKTYTLTLKETLDGYTEEEDN